MRFGRGDIDFLQIHVGDKLWKTSDPDLDRRLRQSFSGVEPRFQRDVHMEVHGHVGCPLTLIVRDELGNVVQLDSSKLLAAAERQPLTEQRLREQLGRLGGTPFKLGRLLNRIEGEAILPLSELNRLRREAVAQLAQRRAQPLRWTLQEPRVSDADARAVAEVPAEAGLKPHTPQLLVLVRTQSQLEAALAWGAATVYCEFEDPKRYREAVRLVRNSAGPAGFARTVWVAPPRIFKTGEEWTLKQVRSCEADGYLVRNFEHLRFFEGSRLVGDFSFNVANRLSAEWLMQRERGLERLTASYDLNGTQLVSLLRAGPPDWFEVTIHQHMPMFHMEHCVFCAFLSTGTDYTNCGRPCDRHEVRLRDRVGAEHVLKADAGCRNTVFNAAAQTGAELVHDLLAVGARYFRVEFVQETADQVQRTLTSYGQLLRGEMTGNQLWRELKLVNQLGVTRGSLDKR